MESPEVACDAEELDLSMMTISGPAADAVTPPIASRTVSNSSGAGGRRKKRREEAAEPKKPVLNRRKQLPPNVALALNGSVPVRGVEEGQRFYTDDGFAEDSNMNPFLEAARLYVESVDQELKCRGDLFLDSDGLADLHETDE
ncbi:unnamed protein product, partial [Symbiodinium microadriaticum]